MLNSVVIMGRLTAAPEIRTTTSGTACTEFTVAVERKYKNEDGQQADFIDVVAWRNTAEFVCKYFGKGNMIAIQGYLQTRTFKDKTGNKRKATELIAENVSFCGALSR